LSGVARALRVAIVGGGSAGSSLAILLSQMGADVVVLDDGRKAPLVVGESLVPGVVPILRRLGIEADVAKLGVLKPGVTFGWSDEDVFRFNFVRFQHHFPPYAYNVPRPAFDQLIGEAARRRGVRIVEERAKLERSGVDGVVLAPATLAAGGYTEGGPDLIVDATGRARTIARLLDLPTRRGPRDDVAHFAHFQGFTWDEAPGQVVITRLRAGWSWRIPLADRLSVGIVLRRDAAGALGSTPEERLERAIAEDPALAAAGRSRTRVSPVVTYGNYQLVTERAHGPGWVLAGYAFGFFDPMLSPGVFLALDSAERLARALAPAVGRMRANGAAGDLTVALDRYAAEVTRQLDAWIELVDSIYEGRLFGLFRAGADLTRNYDNVVTRAIDRHVGKHVAAMATGVRTTARYSRGLIRFMARYGMRGVDPRSMAVR
jgi:flavin-dependent dehydrogenase